MNADLFRQYYAYHFSENRTLWERAIVPLSEEQFTHPSDYSLGSVRNHVVHLVDVDEVWFMGLRGEEPPEEPNVFGERAAIRAKWDAVEEGMRAYLADLRDDMLLSKPFVIEEDRDLMVWQVLLHVINHGTDHRAQIRRLLHDLGVSTGPQDYIFHVYDNLPGG